MSDGQAIEGGGFRVVFQRLSDRFSHRVEWMDRGRANSLVNRSKALPTKTGPRVRRCKNCTSSAARAEFNWRYWSVGPAQAIGR